MHTDLSSHLHSEKCNTLINLLKQCHSDYPVRRFFGICNDLDAQMCRCLKDERIQRSKRNREKAKETQEKLRQLA